MWCKHFSHITVASPAISVEQAEADKMVSWAPLHIQYLGPVEIEFISLPQTHTPFSFIKSYGQVRKRLNQLIKKSKYLHFAIGGFLGDWGSVAAFEAFKLNRPYSVHMDWIAHNVMKQTLNRNDSILKKFKKTLHSAIMRFWNNRAIAKAYAALCNGKTCYDYYKTINQNSFKIYDIHIGSKDLADQTLLLRKKEQAKKRQMLYICYTGRMDPMKAPLDWLNAIAYARNFGAVNIQATWFGDGPLREEVLKTIQKLNLQEIVKTPGYEPNRQSIMTALEQADIFLMTHISDESPRCIIEAIMKGTPVFGYTSAYALDILGKELEPGLCSLGNWEALGEEIISIYHHRNRLVERIDFTAKRGKLFTDEAVFQERACIIKKTLS